MERISSLERNTKETQIKLTLNLDGEGKTNIVNCLEIDCLLYNIF